MGPTGQQDDHQDGAYDQDVSVTVAKSVITVSQLEYLSVTSLRRQFRDPDKPTGSLSEVVGAGTPGPVENAPPGGESTFGREEYNLVVDVSAPPTGQGVTDEDDVQQGEVNTHTESSSTTVGEFSPEQYPFSSVAVVVPPLRLTASSPASPHTIQPAT